MKKGYLQKKNLYNIMVKFEGEYYIAGQAFKYDKFILDSDGIGLGFV